MNANIKKNLVLTYFEVCLKKLCSEHYSKAFQIDLFLFLFCAPNFICRTALFVPH